MATKPPKDGVITLSLLDRLIDTDPDARTELPASRDRMLAELRAAVKRDLEHLLNTRIRVTSVACALVEVDNSLMNYGIPDFFALNPGKQDGNQEIRRAIELALRRFENRLTRVSVQTLDNADPADRVLRFRIDALLNVEPGPEPVVFDTQVEPLNRKVEVKAARNG